ncbi:MAG: NAD-dependent epimerase/dehydratase family protein [Acidimicrobiales bacterium]
MKILVIGGTGPTGPYIVNGLHQRGHQVTLLHTGNHEVDTIPPQSVIPHIHADPFDDGSFRDAIGNQTWDLVFAMYGRLRTIAPALQGVTPRLFSIGGVPVYAGYNEGSNLFPTGMAFPAREDSAKVGERDADKPRKILQSEELVFRLHPDATHFRYPYIYGPNQVIPREWPIVRRALDGRPVLILADGGLTQHTAAYVENVAHAVLLAVDHIDESAGTAYNVGDDVWYSLAQVAEVVQDELGHRFEIVNLPGELARPAFPLLMHHNTEHRVTDCSLIRQELGYRDVVAPLEGLRATIRWQVANLAKDHARVDEMQQDPYDYAAEDRLAKLYRDFAAACRAVPFESEPGWTFGYYGSRTNPGGARGSFRAG